MTVEPYRTPGKVPDERGGGPMALVSELVDQFAEPYAFIRELVQNSLDAGTSAVWVEIEYDGVSAYTRVRDDGKGMNRRGIEDYLLTLFASSKEDDSSLIGKYGVGFVSVFAISPRVVRVTTSDGSEASEVLIYPDHSFELSDKGLDAPRGTTVELENELDGEAFAEHRREVLSALIHFCAHAQKPIWVRTTEAGKSQEQRVDEPFAAVGAAGIVLTVDDETYAIAIARGSVGRAQFYKHGLLLWEVPSAQLPELGHLNIKISSPNLRHTISRDSVVQDGAFKQVLSRAKLLATMHVPERLLEEVERSADQIGKSLSLRQGLPEQWYTYSGLMACALNPALGVQGEDLSWPLCESFDGRYSCTGRQLKGLQKTNVPVFAIAPTALTQALAEQGRAVVYAPPDLAHGIAASLGFEPHFARAHESFTLVRASPEQLGDSKLLLAIENCLRAVGEPVEKVCMCEFEGRRFADFAIALPVVPPVILSAHQELPHGKADNAVLCLDAHHELVAVARLQIRRAPSAAREIASLLMRLYFLELRGPGTREFSDELLRFALEER